MKFKFPYEKVLIQRKTEKDVAERDFQESFKQVRDHEKKIRDLYTSIDEARLRAHDLVVEGGQKVEELIWIDGFIRGQNVKIKNEKQVLRGLQQIMDDRRERLIYAAREFKILEKLKENLFDRHRREQNKRDQKLMDEIVVTRSGRNRIYGN